MMPFTNIELAEEIWKNVPDYEGFYQVSDLGRVRSLDREVTKNNGVIQRNSGKLLAAAYSPNMNYPTVVLSKQGKTRTFELHKLVSLTFMDHTPSRFRAVVDHKDENPLNNRLNNLQIVSNRYNTVKGNKCRNNKVASVGVRIENSKYQSYIRPTGNKQIYLGAFFTEEEASVTYQKALSKILEDEDFCRSSKMSPKEWRQYLLN